MRDISKIMDKLQTLHPQLELSFRSIRASVSYTAPEAMRWRWLELQEVLNAEATVQNGVPELKLKRMRNIFADIDEMSGLTADEIVTSMKEQNGSN